MNKKKLAFIMNDMVMGGAEKVLCNLLDQLDYSILEVTLFIPTKNGILTSRVNKNVKIITDEDIERKNIKCNVIRKAKKLFYRALSKYYLHNYHKNLYYYLCSQDYYSNIVFDCVIVYKAIDLRSLVIGSKCIKAKKRCCWIHGDPHTSNERSKIFSKEFRNYQTIVCVSNRIKELFISQYPREKNKCTVIYNCYNEAEIIAKSKNQHKMHNEKIKIVSVGRLTPEKGHIRVPEIAKKLSERGYDFIWYIIGDGIEKEKIANSILKYNLSDRIQLLGEIENPYPYIKSADIYVQPSFSEGYCTVTMEAKILGVPVVTTEVPGMDEQFQNGQDGIVVESSTEGLVEGIQRLLDSKDLYQKIKDTLATEDNSNTREIDKIYYIIC